MTYRTRPAQITTGGIILRNIAQCLLCEDVVESRHVHDFQTCKCGALSVDGGHEYLRRLGDPNNIKELNEYAESD